MALPTERLDGPPERTSGDFARNANTGAPYVDHPTETTKSGRPKRVMYGRPSSFGAALDSAYNLVKWKERQVLRGAALLDLDPWADLDDAELDQLAARCHEAAGSNLAAQRGTHVHLLTEHADRWGTPTPPELIAAGEALGIPAALQRAVVDQWTTFRRAVRITALDVEANVVHDGWRLAGTMDRRDRIDTEMVTPFGTIEAGDVVVGDIKTGGLTLGRDGQPNYWVKYPVQLVAYADGLRYDVETDTRHAWDPPHRTDVALIYHYDLARALDGENVEWTIIPVSLAAGREGGDLCRLAADFAKRRDMFAPVAAAAPSGDGGSEGAAVPNTAVPSSIAPGPSPASGPGAPSADPGVEQAPVEQPATGAAAPSGGATSAAAPVARPPLGGSARASASPTAQMVAAGDEEAQRDALRARWERMRVNAAQAGREHEFIAEWTARGVGPHSSIAEVAAALDAIEPPFDVVTEPAPERETAAEPVAVERPVDPADARALVDRVAASAARAVVNGWLEHRGGAPSWHPVAHPTVANYERTRAALALGEATDGDEDTARLLLATATIASTAELHAHPIGAWIASLLPDECARVIALCEAFGSTLGLRFDAGGQP